MKREVRVVLSKGSATVIMPDFRGLSLDQAQKFMSRSQIKIGRLSQAYGFGLEQQRDRIIAQFPEPMTSVKAGTRVDLLLSLGPGPEYIIMPDLTGQPYSLALSTLGQAGLALGRLHKAQRPSWPAETVMIQDPSPGSRVAKGGLVELTVNRPGEEDEPYRLVLIEYHVQNGLLRREVRLRVEVEGNMVEFHHDWHRPGEQVRVMALVKGQPRVRVFEDGDEKPWPDGETLF